MVVEPEGRAWMEARADHCFGKLAEVLDERGYSHALSLQWSVANPSIVDATEAFREEQAVDVALLSDGPRMHAVAPFLRHRRARALVRYAESMAELPDRRLCVFARSIQEDSAMQAFQRTLLVCIALVAFAGFALGLHRARRRMPER